MLYRKSWLQPPQKQHQAALPSAGKRRQGHDMVDIPPTLHTTPGTHVNGKLTLGGNIAECEGTPPAQAPSCDTWHTVTPMSWPQQRNNMTLMGGAPSQSEAECLA